MPSGLPGENSLRDGNTAAAPDHLIQARASKDVKSKILFHRAEQRGVLPILHKLELSGIQGGLIAARDGSSERGAALSALAFPMPIATPAEHAIIARLAAIAIGCRHREAKPQKLAHGRRTGRHPVLEPEIVKRRQLVWRQHDLQSFVARIGHRSPTAK